MKHFFTYLVLSTLLAIPFSSFAESPEESEFWTPAAYCPQISDTPLRYGAHDTKKSERVREIQHFLTDYYNIELTLATGVFDRETERYVTLLNKEGGLTQKFVDKKTRAIVNSRCRSAGIRPRITLSASSENIKKGEVVSLTATAQNADSCRMWNLTEALGHLYKPENWAGYDALYILGNGHGTTTNQFNMLVSPKKTSVYQFDCDHNRLYTAEHGGLYETTQILKVVTITVK